VPILIHGFSKNEQVAKELVANGCYISFGKYLMRMPQLELVFKDIPNDRFFLETDTDEQTIQEVYALAAQYKGLSIPQIQELVTINFSAIFGTHYPIKQITK
jgi:TatD DNase family protein